MRITMRAVTGSSVDTAQAPAFNALVRLGDIRCSPYRSLNPQESGKGKLFARIDFPHFMH